MLYFLHAPKTVKKQWKRKKTNKNNVRRDIFQFASNFRGGERCCSSHTETATKKGKKSWLMHVAEKCEERRRMRGAVAAGWPVENLQSYQQRTVGEVSLLGCLCPIYSAYVEGRLYQSAQLWADLARQQLHASFRFVSARCGSDPQCPTSALGKWNGQVKRAFLSGFCILKFLNGINSFACFNFM